MLNDSICSPNKSLFALQNNYNIKRNTLNRFYFVTKPNYC